MLLLIAAFIIAAALWLAAREIAGEIRAAREDAGRGRTLAILQAFAPGIGAAHNDPRALLVWQPLARAARQAFPAECAALDKAAGGTFPFTADQIQAAHSRWTTEWLAWERRHDADYKQKAAEIEEQILAARPPRAAGWMPWSAKSWTCTSGITRNMYRSRRRCRA